MTQKGRVNRLIAVAFLPLILLLSSPIQATSNGGSAVELVRVSAKGAFQNPVWMEPIPGTDSDWVVVEQTGRVVRFREGVQAAPVVVLDLRSRVVWW
jgi:hypothetical protein